MKRILLRLVALFPAGFVAQFGAEMREQLAADYEEARDRGRIAALAFALSSAWDVARAAVAERMRPTWAAAPSSEGTVMKWHTRWVSDLRQAVRSLRRYPGFAATTVGTLALAIGVNAGMFSVVKTVLLDPLPYADEDRLMFIAASAPGSGFPDEFGPTNEMYVEYKAQSTLIEDLSNIVSFTSTLRVGDRAERVRMSWPTSSIYSTLGVKPLLGRVPVADDREQVLLISFRLWQDWYHGDSSVIGRLAEVDGRQKRIIGVMPPSFKFPNDETVLWISSMITPQDITTPGRSGAPLVARVKPGTTPEQLAAELTNISKTLPRKYGGSESYAKLIAQHRAIVRPYRDDLLGSVSRPLWVLLGSVLVVLLIACANVGNLFMVRAESRQRDLAVRRAIGASRGQLVQSQMAEAIVIAASAGALAMLLAYVTLPAFVRAAPPRIPRIADVHVSAATLAFALLAATLAAIVCGLYPALRASLPDLARLRDGGRGATRRRGWARDGLVAGQASLALVLLIGSGLLMRSFWSLRHVRPGYSTENLFTFQIAPEGPSLRNGMDYARFDLEFMKRLRALPGVETVGLVENVPLDEGTATSRFRSEDMGANAEGTVLNYTFSAGDYYKAMGIAVLRGRPFADDDHHPGDPQVVISKSAAQILWPGQDPIGKRMQRTSAQAWSTVIGVVDDVMQNDFRHTPDPLVYFPLVGPQGKEWSISSPAYVVKTKRAESIGPEIRKLVHDVAPGAPMYRVFTMAGLAQRSMVQLSFTMLTLAIVSSLALILTAVGLYGVLSYLVAQRTREIGVRMALGAEAAQVRRMVVGQGARVVALGAIVGVAIALVLTRALRSLLYEVNPVDAPTFAAMSASIIVIGLASSYLPARRASLVDPTESLRGE